MASWKGCRAFISVYPFGRNITWVTLLPSLLRLYNVHEGWHAQARSQWRIHVFGISANAGHIQRKVISPCGRHPLSQSYSLDNAWWLAWEYAIGIIEFIHFGGINAIALPPILIVAYNMFFLISTFFVGRCNFISQQLCLWMWFKVCFFYYGVIQRRPNLDFLSVACARQYREQQGEWYKEMNLVHKI